VVVGFSHLRHLKPPQQPELQSPLHSQQQLSFTQPAASSRHSLHRRLYCCCLSRIFLHQVPLMRDPETMLGHCVSCHQVFDAEGNLIQVKTPLTPPPAPPSRPASLPPHSLRPLRRTTRCHVVANFPITCTAHPGAEKNEVPPAPEIYLLPSPRHMGHMVCASGPPLPQVTWITWVTWCVPLDQPQLLLFAGQWHRLILPHTIPSTTSGQLEPRPFHRSTADERPKSNIQRPSGKWPSFLAITNHTTLSDSDSSP
jgi:hypothetical protein